MSERPDTAALVETVRAARRSVIAGLIAVKGHLDTPYPDDPRWTPWTRFVEPELRRLDEMLDALTALAERIAELEDDLDAWQGMCADRDGRIAELERQRDEVSEHSREASEMYVRSNEQVTELLSQQAFTEHRLRGQIDRIRATEREIAEAEAALERIAGAPSRTDNEDERLIAARVLRSLRGETTDA